jgi:hypothetical protein
MDVAKFDRRLYEMKLLEPSLHMQSATRAAWRQVRAEQKKFGQGEGVGFYAKLVDSALSVLAEYLKEVDRICREVRKAQGETVTPAFVRTVVRDYAVFTVIAARCGAIRGDIELMARRTRFGQLAPALRHLALEKGHLESRLSNRYEIEARELELSEQQKVATAVQVPYTDGNSVSQKVSKAAIDNKERTGVQPVPRISSAPPPPIEVGGGSWIPSKPKPTEVPENLPPCYPNNLKPQTRLILAEAIRMFPSQAQILELCRYVVSALIPHFSTAVRNKTPRADQVEDIMNDLLHYILVSNCDDSVERFRLQQKTRRSEEWLKLSREVARVAADVGESSVRQPESTQFQDAADDAKRRLVWAIQEVAGRLMGTPITLLGRSFLDGSRPGIMDGFARLFAIGRQFPTEIDFHPSEWARATAEKVIANCISATPYQIALPQIQSLLNRIATEANDSKQQRELKQITSINVVDSSLVKLGIVNFSLDRLNQESTEHLLQLLAQAEERLGRLRRANSVRGTDAVGAETESDHLMAQAVALVKQIKTVLVLRNTLSVTTEPGDKPENAPREPAPFTHSLDYRSVSLRGKTHSLTPRQAQLIQILHEAHESGNPEVSHAFILEKMETNNSRWQDTFKSNRDAKKALIRIGATRGTLRLNL